MLYSVSKKFGAVDLTPVQKCGLWFISTWLSSISNITYHNPKISPSVYKHYKPNTRKSSPSWVNAAWRTYIVNTFKRPTATLSYIH